jgi:hypothetical protein
MMDTAKHLLIKEISIASRAAEAKVEAEINAMFPVQ